MPSKRYTPWRNSNQNENKTITQMEYWEYKVITHPMTKSRYWLERKERRGSKNRKKIRLCWLRVSPIVLKIPGEICNRITVSMRNEWHIPSSKPPSNRSARIFALQSLNRRNPSGCNHRVGWDGVERFRLDVHNNRPSILAILNQYRRA